MPPRPFAGKRGGALFFGCSLQEGEFEPVGSRKTLRVDVGVIAATNRDLEEAVSSGRFLSDLYYRINVLPLRVPPLRERKSDLPESVTLLLSRFSKKFGKETDFISETIGP